MNTFACALAFTVELQKNRPPKTVFAFNGSINIPSRADVNRFMAFVFINLLIIIIWLLNFVFLFLFHLFVAVFRSEVCVSGNIPSRRGTATNINIRFSPIEKVS